MPVRRDKACGFARYKGLNAMDCSGQSRDNESQGRPEVSLRSRWKLLELGSPDVELDGSGEGSSKLCCPISVRSRLKCGAGHLVGEVISDSTNQVEGASKLFAD